MMESFLRPQQLLFILEGSTWLISYSISGHRTPKTGQAVLDLSCCSVCMHLLPAQSSSRTCVTLFLAGLGTVFRTGLYDSGYSPNHRLCIPANLSFLKTYFLDLSKQSVPWNSAHLRRKKVILVESLSFFFSFQSFILRIAYNRKFSYFIWGIKGD